MPPLLHELMWFISRMPISRTHPTLWKRLRFAVSGEEMAIIRDYCKVYNPKAEFIHSIRGVPLQVEPSPENPLYLMEYDNAAPLT